jgi:hypothetical protein
MDEGQAQPDRDGRETGGRPAVGGAEDHAHEEEGQHDFREKGRDQR